MIGSVLYEQMYRLKTAHTSKDVVCRNDMQTASRVILHVDLNCFYAQAECFRRPEIRSSPVVVGGDEEARHGIVLAKNEIAKALGIKTGQTLWEARQKSSDLVVVRADLAHYQKIAKMARDIYYDYTHQVEPFGLDECWLDVTGTAHLYGGLEHAGQLIAEEISERTKSELGMSVSIGVSWNKIFAKFGSDFKKPDAITYVTPANYQDIVWNSPARELLYVGPATEKKLYKSGILTIGDIAECTPRRMKNMLGKMGEVIHVFALGLDTSPVAEMCERERDVSYGIKSIGNSLTSPFDVVTPEDAKALIYMLSQSVAHRMRESKLKAKTVTLSVRHSDLSRYTTQRKLLVPSFLTSEIADCAYSLLIEREDFVRRTVLRSLGVRGSDLVSMWQPSQSTFLAPEHKRIAAEKLEYDIDDLRRRFGNKVVVRGCELYGAGTLGRDIKRDNTVHPVSFFA